MNMKAKSNAKAGAKRSNIIIAAVGAAAILLVLGLIIGLELEPMITGNGAFSGAVNSLKGEAAQNIIITDFYSESEAFPDTLQVTVTEADEVSELRELFLAVAQSASFSGAKKSVLGSFDINLDFTLAQGNASFFITESAIYIERGVYQYYFTPADAEAHARLFEAVLKCL